MAAYALGNLFHGVILPDHAFGQSGGEPQRLFGLARQHPASRDAGPVLHHGSHGVAVDRRQDQRRLALRFCEFGHQLPQPREIGSRIGWRRIGSGRLIRFGFGRFDLRYIGACGFGDRLRRRHGIERHTLAAQPGAQFEYLANQRLFPIPTFLRGSKREFGLGKPGFDPSLPVGHADAYRCLAADDGALDLQRLAAAHNVLHLGRSGMLRNGDTGAGGVEKAHGLVGQLPRRDVAVGEADRRLDRLIEYLHLVMLLELTGDTAQHENGHRFRRLIYLDDLETASERRVLLDVLLVFGPGRCRDRAKLTACQRRLQQIGRIAGSCRAAGADQCVSFVNEQDDRRFGGLHLVNDRLQPFFEFALYACARLHQADIEHTHTDALQRRRHVALGDAQRKTLDDRGFADPGLAG